MKGVLSSKGEEYEEIEDGSELKLGDAQGTPRLGSLVTLGSTFSGKLCCHWYAFSSYVRHMDVEETTGYG